MRKLLLSILFFLCFIPCVFSDSEITISGHTSSSHLIQEDGVTLRPRPYLNFTGSGATCTDSGGKTVCAITGGSSSSAGDTFKTWDLPAGDNIVADSTTDTVTFTGSNGLSITGTGASDTIAFGLTLSGDATIDSAGAVTLADSVTVTNWVLGTSSATQLEVDTLTEGGNAVPNVTDKLSVFTATTSAELAGVMSDETGTDKLVYNTSPTFVTPLLGTPTSGVLTNCTGTAAGLTAGAVTNATLTTALTVDTGTVGLTGNVANSSVLTLGVGASSFSGTSSGTNTGDNTVATSGDSATDFFSSGEIADAQVSNTLTSSTCTGNASTATALFANGGNCAAGSYPLGVDASGAIEDCTDASAEIDSILATHMAIVSDTDTIGHLNDTDWDTFNGKQAALGYTPVNAADWTTNDSYPAACAAGEYINEIADVSVCVNATTEIDTAIGTHAGDDDAHQALVTVNSPLTIIAQDISIPDASISTKGVSELATAAEVDTGTDATRAVTPDGLQGSKRNIRYLTFVLVASDTDVATDTTIGGDFTIPISGTILQDDTDHDQLAATTDTAGTTGTMIVDVHLNGSTIMDTNKLDIETTEKGTQTAATQPDLTTTAISAGDILTFDIDAIHTTAAKGLKVLMAIRED